MSSVLLWIGVRGESVFQYLNYILSLEQEDRIEVKVINWPEVTLLSQGRGWLNHFCGLDNLHVCVQTT